MNKQHIYKKMMYINANKDIFIVQYLYDCKYYFYQWWISNFGPKKVHVVQLYIEWINNLTVHRFKWKWQKKSS